MTQEQRDHVTAMLIDMIEKLPKSGFDPITYQPESLRAAAEATHALIALEESAKGPAQVKVNRMVGGKTLELPENKARELRAGEAWELVREAILNTTVSTQTTEFEKLPPMVRKVVKRPRQLSEWKLVFDKYKATIACNFMDAFAEAAISAFEGA